MGNEGTWASDYRAPNKPDEKEVTFKGDSSDGAEEWATGWLQCITV